MEYLIILIFLLILLYRYDICKFKHHKCFWYYITLVIFILFAGLRYRLGADSISYENEFNAYYPKLQDLKIQDFLTVRYQPLWVLLNSFCKTFGTWILLQLMCSLIINTTFFYFISKSTSYIFTGVLFYYLFEFCYFNMDILRESIAIGFFLIAITKYSNHKYLQFLIFCFFSIMWHLYAIFLIVFYLFFLLKINLKLKITFVLILIVFLMTLSNATSYLAILGSSYYSLSEGINNYSQYKTIHLTGYLYGFLRILPVIYILHFIKKKGNLLKMKINIEILEHIAYIYIFLVIIRYTSIPYAERFTNYVIIPIHILIFSYIYKMIYNYSRYRQLLVIVIITSVGFIFYFIPLTSTSNQWGIAWYKTYFPYSSIFTNSIDKERETFYFMDGRI